jgi:hypothetical protein
MQLWRMVVWECVGENKVIWKGPSGKNERRFEKDQEGCFEGRGEWRDC